MSLSGILQAIDKIEARLEKHPLLKGDDVCESDKLFPISTRCLYLSMLGECYTKMCSQHYNDYSQVVLNEFKKRALSSYTTAVQLSLKHLCDSDSK